MPRDFRKEADTSFKAWHTRTSRIAKLLDANQIDKALSLCSKQRAAFANFRALYPLVLETNPLWLEHAHEILALNDSIQQKLSSLYQASEVSLANIRKEKARIVRFHSRTDGQGHSSRTLVAHI